MNPWGEERADLRAALGHSLLFNINRDAKKGPARPPSDFMPYLWREPEAPAPNLSARLLESFGLKLEPDKLKKER